MDLGISHRIALVSGGNSGIGLATATMLLEAGCRVAITDVAGDDLDRAAAELSAKGEAIAVAGDVTDQAAVATIWRAVREQLGNPEIFVGAAGVTGATGNFCDIGDDGWRDTLDVNLMGQVRMCLEAIPAMRAAGWGRIVLIASEDAVQPYADELPYCASTASILARAKGLSKAYGPDNLLVNTVSPAFIATPMTDAMMRKRADERGTSFDEAIESFLEEERPNMALKRRGRVEEVAAAIAFLCSERASFVNGADLRVDCGSVATIS